MHDKIAFLFGAGVSIPSGILKTEEITEKILEGENTIRILSQRNYVFSLGNSEDPYIKRIKELFNILRSNLKNHYSFISREINYEDYFFMVDSMHSDENMEFENPLVSYFSDYLEKVHAQLFDSIGENSSISLITLMGEVKKYISDMVRHHLTQTPEDLSQFSLLRDTYNDKDLSKVYLFTLNHDTFIEQYLKKEDLNYSDGFTQKDDNIKVWDPDSYNNKINLFKLHGSINWSYSLSDDPYEKKVCVYLKSQRDIPETALLIGSFNKLREYSRGINFDLQCLFANYLKECNRLIISGYSFGDQGINSRIINWLYNSKDRKIIVIHKNSEELFQNARPAISSIRKRDISEQTNLFKIIPKWFEKTNWQEIKEKLN